MAKVRVAGNRFSMGSWSIPFRSDGHRKKKGRNFNGTPVRIANEENNSTSFDPAPPANSITPSFDKALNPSLIELAATITRETEKLDRYLRDSESVMPGFDVDSPANFPDVPEDIKRAREEVLRATKELGDLVTGPTEGIRWMAWDHHNSLSLQAVYHYKIAQAFPPGSTATFSEIAQKVGLDELNTRRFLRHAMTNRIFHEPNPGTVAHTAASRALAEDSALSSWVGFCVDDIWPAATKVMKALELNPVADDVKQTAFCVENGTVDQEPMFVTFGKDPKRAKRFGEAMVSLTSGEGYEVKYIVDGYDWAAIDAVGGTVVDIGGSHGFVCIDLANHYPNLHFVVQDLPKMIVSAPTLPSHLSSRIQFIAHDFYTPQPVKGADVYLFRWILHNQSDKYALTMLRALIPALKKGARVIINDHCLPEPGQESLWDERIIRSMDLVMLTLLNAQERTKEEFEALFTQADERFLFLRAQRPKGCRMSIVEAVWDGEDYDGE